MKYVNAPMTETIRIRNLYDVPMTEGVIEDANDPQCGKPKPALKTYQDFLLERTVDEQFLSQGGEKKGIDAIELVMSARNQIKATKGVHGVHAFEDEVAKRLQAAILNPKSLPLCTPGLEHNFYEWCLAWKQLADAPPAVLAVEEGAAA